MKIYNGGPSYCMFHVPFLNYPCKLEGASDVLFSYTSLLRVITSIFAMNGKPWYKVRHAFIANLARHIGDFHDGRR